MPTWNYAYVRRDGKRCMVFPSKIMADALKKRFPASCSTSASSGENCVSLMSRDEAVNAFVFMIESLGKEGREPFSAETNSEENDLRCLHFRHAE